MRLGVVGFFLLVGLSFCSFGQISSNFNVNAEGWTAPGSVNPGIVYNATGGNPGGAVSAGDAPVGAALVVWYFQAPAAYTGNLSAYYNGTLTFDLSRTAGSTPIQRADIILSSGTTTIYYFNLSPTTPTTYPVWKTYSVRLNEVSGNWKTSNSATGTAATAAEIQFVLANMFTFQIRGRFGSGTLATTYMDNVSLDVFKITTQPVTPITVCDGTTTSFTAAAAGLGTITYQWEKFNGVTGGWFLVVDGAGYSGATTGTLNINTTGNFGAGTYRCRASIVGANPIWSNSAVLNINPTPAAPTTTGSSACGSAALTLTASGGSAGQYRWYIVASGGTPIAGQTNASYTTPVLTTTTTYYVAVNNGTCESARTAVVATINTIPSAPTTTGASACGSSAVTLNASGGSAGQYRWYTVSTGGTAIAGQTNSSYTTPVLTGTTTYYVALNNGLCEGARTSVVATINTIPAAPTTTGNSACGSSAITLNASGGSAGEFRWYTVPTGGTAIAGQTNGSYTTPVLTLTTTYYVAVNNGFCEGARAAVVATINTIPAAPSTTGASACGSAALTLSASGGTAGQYRWYTVSTGGTAIAGQTNSTYTTPVLASTTTYYVALNNGLCEGARTAVVATINTIPGAPSTTGASACGSSALTLTASGGSAGEYRWYTVSTGGTAIAGQTNSSYTTPVLTGTTTYYVALNNGFCEGARSSVVATINTIPAAPSTIGASACGSAALTLTASGGAAGEYRWYTVSTGGTAIAGQTNATYTTPVLTGTTTYYVALNNGFCEGARASVVATINTIPAAPSTTGASACGSSAVTLTASGGTAGQYRWYTVSTGGTAIAGQTNSSYTTPVLTLTTTYYVALNNGLCEGTRTAVIATINTIPSAPSTTGASACGSSAVTLTASGGAAGEYRWYTVASGGTAIAGQTNNSYTTPVLTGTTTYYVALNNGLCEGARTSVVATINSIPAAPSTTGSSACGSSALTLTASGGAAGEFRWYTVSSGGTAIAGQTNNSYTTPVLTLTTTYYVAVNNGFCEGARTAVVATINTIPAAPSTTGASACGSSAVTLTASGGAAGEYRWYTVASGGTAIAGQTNSTYTTPVLTGTTTYYVALNNGFCEGARTSVVATINTIPAAPSTTGNSACGSSAVTVSASGGSAGEYRWYTVASGGTAIAGQTSNTYTTPVLTLTTTYYVALNNGLCEGARTAVVATINTIPAAPSATGASACGSSAVTLNASGGTAGQYRWYTVPTGGTAIAGQTNSSYTTPVLTGTTTYYVALNNGFCEGTRTSVVATISTIPAAPTTTGNSACGSSAVTLNASGGSAGEYRWYTVSTGGTAIAGQTNSSYTTPVLTGTTTYYVALNNGCEGARTSVVATINTIPAAPTTTGSSACGSSALTLTASGGAAGEFRWYTVSTGGTAIAGQTNATYTTPVLTGTTIYYVSINNGFCEGARTAVVATINTIPAAPSTTSNSACGSSAITVSASGGSSGEYRWYTVSTGGTAIAGQTNGSYTTPVLTLTTTYYVAINNGFCEGARSAVVATINTIPATPATTGASACGSSALTLNASGGASGEYRWYTVSTGGTAIAGQTNSSYLTPVLTGTTTYYVALNNGLCEGARTAVVATINTIPAAPSTTGASACGSSVVTINASGGSAGQYRWYTVSTGGTAIAGQTNSSYTTPLLTLTTTYYVALNNGLCEGARTAVIATINTIPSAPSTIGASACGSSAVTLSASGGAAGEFRWYAVASGGTAIAGQTNASYTTPVLTGTTTYYVALNNGFCEGARTAVVATINTIPAAPSTTGNSACGSSAVTLNASGGSVGEYRWYTVASGGTAIAGQTSNTYTTPVLTLTTTYYVALNNGLCEGARTAVVATINTIPAAPTTTGSSACGSSTLTLNASGGTAGQYRWYTVSTGGTAIAGQTNAAYTTPVLTGTTTYYVALNNGFCEGARAAVVATINTIPAAPSTTGNSACGSSAVTLNASGGSAGQYRWYTVSTGGPAIAGQTSNTYTTPVLTLTTTFYVALNNGLCEGARTAVVATINTIPAAPSTTGASACGSSAVTLNASGGTAGQYRWYTVSTGGTAIAGQTNSAYTTPILGSTTTYHVAINNGLCEGARTSVVATINTIPAAPSTTSNSSCGPAAITLNASGGSAGQYRWYTVSTGGTPITGETSNAYLTPVLLSTTIYYVSLNNGLCEGPRTAVVATVNSIPSAPSATGSSSCTPTALTLTAAGGTAGQYRWYTVSMGGSPIAGQTTASYTTPVISTTTTYYVSIDNGICESARTSVLAQINSPSSTPNTTDSNSCGPGAVTLSAMGGTNGQYRWYTSASGGSPISGEVNDTYTTPSLTVTTTFYVSIDNGVCESNRASVTAFIFPILSPPIGIPGTACAPSSSVTLAASGGSNGQYRWYSTATGGTPIPGETNSDYITPVISSSTTYFVSINDGICESQRTPVLAQLISCTPQIDAASLATEAGSEVTFDLATLVSTVRNALDINSISVIQQPISGAIATVTAGQLVVDYANITFTGTDRLTIEACDVAAHCAQREITIEVAGEIKVYNAMSPNGDGKNEILFIQSIDGLTATKNNTVTIFDRWGNVVFEVDNYDNVDRVFRGLSTDGEELPAGTYYYKIYFPSGAESKTGFISLKK